MRAAPTQDEVRRQNLGALLRWVHLHGATSRAELTTLVGLNRSTIGALTADLAAAGLVAEDTPKGLRRAGRPSLVVRPESASVYAYAASIEVDRLRAARVGLGGVILDRREQPRPRGGQIPETVTPLAPLVPGMHRRGPPPPAPPRGGGAGGGPGGRPGGPRPARSTSAAESRWPAWCAARTAWSGSARTSAGWTSRSARHSPRNWAATSRSRSATTRTWPRSSSTPAARRSAPTTSST